MSQETIESDAVMSLLCMTEEEDMNLVDLQPPLPMLQKDHIRSTKVKASLPAIKSQLNSYKRTRQTIKTEAATATSSSANSVVHK